MSMTESEALEVLKKPTEHIRAEDDDCIFSSAYARALETAMDALEEIQQYRAIGTVEQLEWCKDASHWKEMYKERLEQYEAIGTVSEFAELKEKATARKPILNPICKCPICDHVLPYALVKYCSNCGTALDCSEGKE